MSDADEQTTPMTFDECKDTAINERIDADNFNDQGWSPRKGCHIILHPNQQPRVIGMEESFAKHLHSIFYYTTCKKETESNDD
jgi:hypothetical protein